MTKIKPLKPCPFCGSKAKMDKKIKVTTEWLKEQGACSEGLEYVKDFGTDDPVEFIEKLLTDKKLDWASWLIVRLLNRKQKIQCAVFAAEQVIDIFEKEFPNDKRPREAIEAARAVLVSDTKKEREAANAANAAANAGMKEKIIRYGLELWRGK